MAKLGMPPCWNNLYFVQQALGSNHCQIHAINNTLGFCIATPESLLCFIDIQIGDSPTCEGWHHFYEKYTGFIDSVIEAWTSSKNIVQTTVHSLTSRNRDVCLTLDYLAELHWLQLFPLQKQPTCLRSQKNQWGLETPLFSNKQIYGLACSYHSPLHSLQTRLCTNQSYRG